MKQLIKKILREDFDWVEDMDTPETPKDAVIEGMAIQFNTIKDLKRVYKWFKKEGFKDDETMSFYVNVFRDKPNFNIFFYHPSFDTLDLATKVWFNQEGKSNYYIVDVKDLDFID